MKKFLGTTTIIIVLVLAAFFYWRYYYTYSEGNRTGLLQKFSHKGNVFKTYEGELVLSSIQSPGGVGIASEKFEFSVVDEKVANILMSHSGATLELHYKEYLGSIPWRGMSKYIVDSVMSIKAEAAPLNNELIK